MKTTFIGFRRTLRIATGLASTGVAGFLLLGGSAAPAGAQTPLTYTGMVKDSSSKAPIAGATVTLLSNPMVTAVSGADGSFTLNLPDPTAIRADRAGNTLALSGSDLALGVGPRGADFSAEFHGLDGARLRSLHRGRLAPGSHVLPALPAGIPAGIYLVRARLGGLARTFRISTVGSAPGRASRFLTASASAALAKRAAAEFLVVVKEGYLRRHHMITAPEQAQNVALIANAPATANLKIFSDQVFPEIEWAHAAIYAWEQTSVLQVDSTGQGFGGSVAVMKIATAEGYLWNGWAFHVAKQDNGTQPTADLTPYKGGSLHLAIKGTTPTVGVMMSSINQGQGSAPLVDLGAKGYLPDDQWHEITIPLAEFDGTSLNLAEVFVYCGFVAPNTMGGTFDPLTTYMVDDIWFAPAK